MTVSSRRGMTLVEILAVVVILGLLAVTLTVGITGKMGKAKQEIAKTQIGQIVAQVQTFQLEHRKLPSPAEGLAALTTDPNAAFYLEPAKLNDPWGKPYQYAVPGPDKHPFEIISYGADGQPGGSGDNADISSVSFGK
jgi:general secretion pathway protein G